MTTGDAPHPPGPGGGTGDQDWREAGDAWGHAANDWSCLYEHYALDVIAAMFDAVAIGPDTRLLDIACGAGLAMRLASSRGATVAGIDAAAALADIARARNPEADVRTGSMFELPWGDGAFDAAVSVNGIWGGCEAALDEAFRVLRPGARIGISFWGKGPPLDLRPCFKVFGRHAPEQHFTSMKRINDISAAGTAEAMLGASGFEVIERGQRVSVIEWPDAELAWRALSSIGPAVPALRHGATDAIKADLLAAIAGCRDGRGIYRFCNDHQYVIARKPPLR
jgi:SAM-dependent methyltransferase